MRNVKRYLVGLALSAVGLVVFGCGDTTRNDQGVSFNFTGWYADGEGESGILAAWFPLNEDVSPGAVEISGAAGSVPWAAGMPVYAGLENHLSGQFIRVERMRLSYYIPGSAIQPPDTSTSIPGMLSPASRAIDAVADGAIDQGSSLPPSYTDEEGNVGFFGAEWISSSVRTWLNFNRSQLPETPFIMVVRGVATGVTSSGKEISSNPVEIDLTMTTDTVINGSSNTDTEEQVDE